MSELARARHDLAISEQVLARVSEQADKARSDPATAPRERERLDEYLAQVRELVAQNRKRVRSLEESAQTAPAGLPGGAGSGATGVSGAATSGEEVAALDLRAAQWVVLSGCDTGLGQIEVDEGILGLRRAFRIAGAETLVMSLWPVEDRSAETFMATLYDTRLNAGRSTSAAMRAGYRAALAAARNEHGEPHPLYWAPFIASGDWR